MTQQPTHDAAPLPKVDPGELATLLIRFIAANFLIFVTAFCLLKHDWLFAAPLALAAALTQRAAVILYRKMKNEYAATTATDQPEQSEKEAARVP